MGYSVPEFAVQVCEALGAMLDVDITEETIMRPIHHGAALRELEKMCPGITATDPADEGKRQVADFVIIHTTALKLLPHYRRQVFKKEQTPSESIERFETDWDALEAYLMGERDKALADFLPEDVAGSGVGGIGFAVTHPPVYPPCRGW